MQASNIYVDPPISTSPAGPLKSRPRGDQIDRQALRLILPAAVEPQRRYAAALHVKPACTGTKAAFMSSRWWTHSASCQVSPAKAVLNGVYEK